MPAARPTTYIDSGTVAVIAGFQGVDKDGRIATLGRGGSDTSAVAIAAAMKAAECLIFTDVDGVYTGWGTPQQARLGNVTVDQVVEMNLPAGSMGPKVAAACGFATQTKNEAVIGSLADIDRIVAGTAGTRVRAG